MSNYDKIPPGVSQPLVKPKSIDNDVPILTLTLWSENKQYSGCELRRVARELCDEIKKGQEVSELTIIGGQKRQLRMSFDPSRLEVYNTSVFQVTAVFTNANFMLTSGADSKDKQVSKVCPHCGARQ